MKNISQEISTFLSLGNFLLQLPWQVLLAVVVTLGVLILISLLSEKAYERAARLISLVKDNTTKNNPKGGNDTK